MRFLFSPFRASLRCLSEAVGIAHIKHPKRGTRYARPRNESLDIEISYVSDKRFAAVTCNLRLLRADARLRLCHVPGQGRPQPKTPRIIPHFPPTKNPRRKSAGARGICATLTHQIIFLHSVLIAPPRPLSAHASCAPHVSSEALLAYLGGQNHRRSVDVPVFPPSSSAIPP